MIPSTVSVGPLPFPPYIIFLLLFAEAEGLWRLTGTKVQTHISWPVSVTMKSGADGPAHIDCLCSCSLWPLLWPLVTLARTLISWLYSQSRGLSATFRSPLFLFNCASQPGRWQTPCDSQQDLFCSVLWSFFQTELLSSAGKGHIKMRSAKVFTVINNFFQVQNPCEDEMNKISLSEHTSTDIYDLRMSNVFHISITCFMKKYEH